MASGRASKRATRAAVALGLSAAYLASATFSLVMPQGAGLWTAAGFLAGLLLLSGKPERWIAAGASVAVQALITLWHGDGPARALIYPLVNLLQSGVAAYLAVRFCGARMRRLSLRALILVLLGAVTPAAVVGGLVGGAAQAVLNHNSFLADWRDWVISASLGMSIVLPALMLVARASQYRDFRGSRVETVGLLAAVAALTAVVTTQSELPLYFAVFPALTLVAFRLGPAGAAVAGFIVGVIALPTAAFRHGPAMLAPDLDMAGRMRLTQFFVAAALFTGLATAGALADQARLRRLLFQRDRVVRAARARAREAELLAARIRPPTTVEPRRTPVHSA